MTHFRSWFLAAAFLTAAAAGAPLAAEPMQIVVGGKTRTYLIDRPAATTPRPTFILLHGLYGNGDSVRRGPGFDRLVPQAGFVGVYPDGLRNRWNFFPPGKEPPDLIEASREIGGAPDDVAFLRALVADLVRRGIADPKRVYLAGTSNGGFMTLRMLCAEAGLFAAIAVVVGAMPDAVGAECRPAKPMPVLILGATADEAVPYDGGPVQPGAAFGVWSTQHLVAFMRRLNGCDEAAERSLLPHPVARIEIERWNKCPGGRVALLRMVGGDHVAPWRHNVWAPLLDFFGGRAQE